MLQISTPLFTDLFRKFVGFLFLLVAGGTLAVEAPVHWTRLNTLATPL